MTFYYGTKQRVIDALRETAKMIEDDADSLLDGAGMKFEQIEITIKIPHNSVPIVSWNFANKPCYKAESEG